VTFPFLSALAASFQAPHAYAYDLPGEQSASYTTAIALAEE